MEGQKSDSESFFAAQPIISYDKAPLRIKFPLPFIDFFVFVPLDVLSSTEGRIASKSHAYTLTDFLSFHNY